MKVYNLRYSPDGDGGNGRDELEEDELDVRNGGFEDSLKTGLDGKPTVKEEEELEEEEEEEEKTVVEEEEEKEEKDLPALNTLERKQLDRLAKEYKLEVDDGIKDADLIKAIEVYETDDAEEKVDSTETIQRLMETVNTLTELLESVDNVDAGKLEDEIELITADEFKEYQEDESQDSMNKLLNKVLKKAVTISDTRSNKIADVKVSNKLSAAQISEKYYMENQDLAPVGSYVMQIAKGLMTKEENKKLSLAELLDKAGKQSRTNLGMPAKSKSKKSSDDDKAKRKVRSRVPGGKGNRSHVRRRVTKQAEGLVAEVNDFVKTQKGNRSL